MKFYTIVEHFAPFNPLQDVDKDVLYEKHWKVRRKFTAVGLLHVGENEITGPKGGGNLFLLLRNKGCQLFLSHSIR